ncbi:hypothetical protein [Butyrivibrio sp.]|uniref:hypothetical protein n=1 Tax=Butyrivibrio sp. TaxID=28121 RepID=UPI0025C18668|nr:hypothetical protein [Butyrivibrio sp.]MBQ9302065.1 hypothetical protein [Butyrivibrio sp.]
MKNAINQNKKVNDWNKIDLRILEQKKKKIVSTKDALKDIIPYSTKREKHV